MKKNGYNKEYRMEILEAMKKSLKSVEEEFNITLNLKKMLYDELSVDYTFACEFNEIDGKSSEQLKFESECAFYQLKPEDYLKEFELKGKTYILIGFNSKSRKFPIRGKDQDGKEYGFTEGVIKNLKDPTVKNNMDNLVDNLVGKLEYLDISNMTPEQMKFASVCKSYGLEPTDYNREFTSNGEKFRLVEIKTRSPKYPFVGVNSKGVRYKFQKVTF